MHRDDGVAGDRLDPLRALFPVHAHGDEAEQPRSAEADHARVDAREAVVDLRGLRPEKKAPGPIPGSHRDATGGLREPERPPRAWRSAVPVERLGPLVPDAGCGRDQRRGMGCSGS
ncbi:hypothetical protein GCM10022221_65100 [Actinocorallia aurea]